MAKYIEAAQRFRTLLRTDEYPVGAEFPAIPEIVRVTGAPHNTAARALGLLADQGDLLVRPGRLTVVLPEPDDSVREIESALEVLDRTGQALRGAVLRSRRTTETQAREVVRRTAAWLRGTDSGLPGLYPEQLEENLVELQLRLDEFAEDSDICPVCQQDDGCDSSCPLRTVRG